MKKLILILTIGCQTLLLMDVKASENNVVRQVLTSENKQPIQVQIAPGYGVNINFANTGEVIEKVWLDNPSFVTIDVDGCLTGLGANNCQQSSASVIHLRRIETLNIPGIPFSNSALMTVITRNSNGINQLYLFQINRVNQPEYLVIEMLRAFTPPPTIVQRPIIDYFLVAAIQGGIRRAERENLLDSSSDLKQRLNKFLQLLKEGNDVEFAANNAGISLALVEELKQLGNYIDVPKVLNRDKGKRLDSKILPYTLFI
jgi:hypothetical protein